MSSEPFPSEHFAYLFKFYEPLPFSKFQICCYYLVFYFTRDGLYQQAYMYIFFMFFWLHHSIDLFQVTNLVHTSFIL